MYEPDNQLQFLPKVFSRNRFRVLSYFFRCAKSYQVTAVLTTSGTNIYNIIGTLNKVKVMLNNNNRMSFIDKCFKRSQ